MTDKAIQLEWHRVAAVKDLPDGRVMTVTAGTRSMALTHVNDQFSAMENRCPHQGGPLGEGSIESDDNGQCWLRCPWHGWDFDPLTGISPGGHDDSGQQLFAVEIRGDDVYVGLEPEPERERTVTDVMAETLVNWGLKSVFGMVGHSNLGLADSIRLQEKAGTIHYYGIRHEGAGAFACSAYAKLTGKPAACLTIAGPGATNLLTGMYDAKVDRAPILALTGQVQVQVFGPGAFQEVDLAAAFEPVARFSQTVLHSSNHAELASLAMKNAIVHRDVAHLIFPDNVQTLPAGNTKAAGPAGRLAANEITPPESAVIDAMALVHESRRPIIIAGYGARDAMDDVVSLAERLNAPVLTTFKAKGQIADDHPLAAGVLGRSGTPVASWFMNECDLIIALGASFSNHTGITPKRPIIQVDFEAMQLGKFHAVSVPVWGEVGVTSRLLSSKLTDVDTIDQTPELAERWEIWRKEKESRRNDDRGKGVNSASIFEVMSQLTPADAIICLDVGNNTYSFGRYFECRQQRILMSGYLGSIGFGFPAAMGAWAATQDFDAYQGRKVVSVSGDGGFGQYLAEFNTAVKYGMDITHILLHNDELGKISKEQKAGEWPVWQTSLHNPNFSSYAKLCGGFGVRVKTADDLEGAIQNALNFNGPAIVEIMSDAELI
jgi:pyruvate oxidase